MFCHSLRKKGWATDVRTCSAIIRGQLRQGRAREGMHLGSRARRGSGQGKWWRSIDIFLGWEALTQIFSFDPQCNSVGSMNSSCRLCEDLWDLLELTHTKNVLLIIGDWNAKVGSQETSGVTGKFGLGVQNEAGQRPTEFRQENTLVIANTLFQQGKTWLYT